MRILVPAFILFLVSGPVFAAAGAWDVKAGNDLYRKGKYSQALECYQKAAEKNPSEARIEYDLGAAAYKSGDFDAAADHFQKSLLTDDDKLKPDVHYNLGDSLYRGGVTREDKDVDAAIRLLEGALGSFEKVLGLNAKDKDASDNRDYIKKELERLKKKKEQQQQQQRQQKDQNKDKDQPRDGQPSKDQASGKDAQRQQQPSGTGQKEEQKKASAGTLKDEDKGVPQEGAQGKTEAQPGPQDQQRSPASGQNDRGQISSQKEANDMVDDLERNDLPKGLLNFTRAAHESRPVDKDW